jgi:hypothetical protein
VRCKHKNIRTYFEKKHFTAGKKEGVLGKGMFARSPVAVDLAISSFSLFGRL